MAPLVLPARAVHAAGLPPAERLADLVRGHVIVHTHGKALWEVADEEWRRLEPRIRQPIVALRDEYQGFWESAIADGVADGTFVVDNVKMAAFAILAMCSGVYKWFSASGPHTAEDLAERYVLYAFSMVGVAPGVELGSASKRSSRAGTH
jgi:hypothetical protein